MADRNEHGRSLAERAATWLVSSRLLLACLVLASTALFVWAGGLLLWNTQAKEQALLIGRVAPTEDAAGDCRIDVLYLEQGELPAQKGAPVHIALEGTGEGKEIDAIFIDKDPQGAWFTIREKLGDLRTGDRPGTGCPIEVDQGRLRLDYRKDRLLTLLLER